MVRLTKIYTRGGDRGQTSLGDGARVAKHDLRVAAYGTVDEANAAIGLARLHADGEADAMLARVQNDLFDLGADLCRPGDDPKDGASLRIQPSQVARLEQEIDRLNATLAPLEFVRPARRQRGIGPSPSGAHDRAPGGAADHRARGGPSGEHQRAAVSEPAVGPPVRARPPPERWRCQRCALAAGRPSLRSPVIELTKNDRSRRSLCNAKNITQPPAKTGSVSPSRGYRREPCRR